MLHLKKMWVVFCLIVLGITLGNLGVPPAKAEDGPDDVLLTGTYTPDQIAAACTDLPVFDLDKASQRAFAEAEKRPVLWTFGVNFDDTQFGNQIPLGCFKLYRRDEALQKYTPINGGFPVDTCEVVGDVTFVDGVATIETGGYVACAMNISAWAKDINAKHSLAELTNFTAHQYQNFTLVAKFSVVTFAKEPAPMPIAAFDPENTPNTPQYDAAVLSLSSAQKLGTCGPLNPKTNYYAWYDLDASIATPKYASQLLGAAATSGCGPALGATPFDFPPSQGKLYIGRDLTSAVRGIIEVDGALIDPTDSKPPEAPTTPESKTPTPAPTPPPAESGDAPNGLCLVGVLVLGLVVGLVLLRQRKTTP